MVGRSALLAVAGAALLPCAANADASARNDRVRYENFALCSAYSDEVAAGAKKSGDEDRRAYYAEMGSAFAEYAVLAGGKLGKTKGQVYDHIDDVWDDLVYGMDELNDEDFYQIDVGIDTHCGEALPGMKNEFVQLHLPWTDAVDVQ